MRQLDGYLQKVLIETDGPPAVWGDVADDWQQQDVDAIAPAVTRLVHEDSPVPTKSRAWWEKPRAHSKTADYAMLLLWILLFSRRRRRAVWVASDQDQGLEGLDAASTIIRHNPWMAELLDVRADKIVNSRTESVCYFTTSDVDSAFGWLNVDLYIFDELVTWRDQRLWTAMFSAAAKRKYAVVLVGTNAGFTETWQAELRTAVAEDPRWCFSALDGPVASWITADRLAEQERLLPGPAYRRLWLNLWQSGTGGDAFTRDDVQACVVLPGPLAGPENGYSYIAGVDLAVRRDASVACIVGVHVGHTERIMPGEPPKVVSRIGKILADIGDTLQQPGDDDWPDPFRPPPQPNAEYHTVDATLRMKLAAMKVWKPTGSRKVELREVRDWLIDQHRRFGLRACAMDPHQGERLAEELQEAGVPVRLIPQTGSVLQDQASALLDAIRERRIDLYDHPDLLADLLAAQILERSYGWRLHHVRSTGDRTRPGTPHGDCTTAVSIAINTAKKHRRPPGPPVVKRQLVYS
jgi:hypothetical protein